MGEKYTLLIWAVLPFEDVSQLSEYLYQVVHLLSSPVLGCRVELGRHHVHDVPQLLFVSYLESFLSLHGLISPEQELDLR